VRFDGPSGRSQSDYVLGAPAHPTQSWEPGEIVKQKQSVTIPDDVTTGRLSIELGVWSPSDRRHLGLRPWWLGWRARGVLHLDVSPDVVTARLPS
jgi:hypothetical protein